MTHATYIGPRKRLSGKRALVQMEKDGKTLLAQFDALNQPEAHGWHRFKVTDFIRHPNVHISSERQQLLTFGTGELTPEEIADGWHFCYDWDGLLIHQFSPEFSCCNCKYEGPLHVK